MPTLDSVNVENTRSVIKNERVFTLKRLVSLLNCSSRTAQTKLKIWNAFTSYNKNGQYYALPGIPQFDTHGLWRFKDIAFSKHGNLKITFVYLVSSASSGLSGKQLGDILGLSPQSFLHHFRKCPGTRREKHHGVYIYFADDPMVYEKQLQKRHTVATISTVMTDSEAIIILVALIKHHGISVGEIFELNEIKRSNLPQSAIQDFLERHGLVKKTPD